MTATPNLVEPDAPATASPAAPPLSSTPPPAPVSSTPPPAPVIPVPTLAPPPVRAPEVEAHVIEATPTSEPLFTIKVWQLGSAVIAVMLVLLYALGLL
jgi:hypothetical protein